MYIYIYICNIYIYTYALDFLIYVDFFNYAHIYIFVYGWNDTLLSCHCRFITSRRASEKLAGREIQHLMKRLNIGDEPVGGVVEVTQLYSHVRVS